MLLQRGLYKKFWNSAFVQKETSLKLNLKNLLSLSIFQFEVSLRGWAHQMGWCEGSQIQNCQFGVFALMRPFLKQNSKNILFYAIF
jgi:hypothetical protein